MFDFKRDNGSWVGGLIWCAFFLAIDVLLGSGLVEAVRSESFDATPGLVTKSNIRPGRKGTVRFEVEYTYVVNGQQYTGTKYHVQPQFVGSGYWHAARDANPVGAPVTVRYDPADPGTAYLAPGLRSDSLFVVWCLTPFNLVGLGFAYAGGWHLFKRRGFDPALRRCVRRTPDGWLARPDANTRFLLSAFAVLLVVTFLGFFVAMGYALAFDFPPPWALPLGMWLLALALPVAFGRWDSRRWLLHVNEAEGTVSFTHIDLRVTLPREDVLGVELTTEARKPKGGSYEVAVIWLRWRDKFDQEQRTKLAEYAEPADAVALEEWLSERLELPSPARVAP